MRIAFLSHQWPGARMGGVGAAIRQACIALADAGHDVHVFTLELPDDVRVCVPANVRMHEVDTLARRVDRQDVAAPLAAAIQAGGDGAYRLSIASLLCDALLRCHQIQPFDVAEAPDVEALGLPLLLGGQFAAPVIMHLHCCTAIARAVNADPHTGRARCTDEQMAGRRRPPSRDDDDRLLEALEFAAIHLADAVCAPTRAVIGATRAFMEVREDVRIIPYVFACGPAPFESLPDRGPILFVGRLERLKGVQTIAASLRLFLPRHPDAQFRFIGPDTNTAPDGRSMRQWIESQLSPALRPRVQFAGELPGNEIAAEWRRARFGVMPSLAENFSMACCEAMGQGRAVIVGAGTGSVEVVGDAGIVVEPDSARGLCDAMEMLWTNRRKLSHLSRASHQRIRGLCAPDAIAAQRVEFYRQAITDFRSSPSASDLQRKLAGLPPACAAAILPALLRMTGVLSGIASTRQTPGGRLLSIMEDIQRNGRSPARVLLYGAGKHTARLLSERHLWESHGHGVVGIIDDHPRFARTPLYLDLPVQSLEGARARLMAGEPIPPVVLSTDTYQDQFWTQTHALREAGVPVVRLYE